MFKTSLVVVLLLAGSARAHDTWIETNTNLVHTGDAVYVDLFLGNHGNDHRDFKMAGKPDIEHSTLRVIGPNGKELDLRDAAIDTGYAPNEGFFKAKIATTTQGLYLVSHTLDQVVTYAPLRAIKSAKTFFVASKSLDQVTKDFTGYDRVLGHALEIVPTSHPVTPMGPGTKIAVKLLYKGKPLANTKIAFIPRGQTLKEGDDPTYERTTDSEGKADFTPKTGNTYLVVAHHTEPKESGEGYKGTKYSAALTVFVPDVCPCCAE